jgi:hypothetical protein
VRGALQREQADVQSAVERDDELVVRRDGRNRSRGPTYAREEAVSHHWFAAPENRAVVERQYHEH